MNEPGHDHGRFTPWGLPGTYWFGVIVSGLALICVAAVLPASAGRGDPSRLDWVGSVLLALGAGQ